jgi:hypothetical protein
MAETDEMTEVLTNYQLNNSFVSPSKRRLNSSITSSQQSSQGSTSSNRNYRPADDVYTSALSGSNEYIHLNEMQMYGETVYHLVRSYIKVNGLQKYSPKCRKDGSLYHLDFDQENKDVWSSSDDEQQDKASQKSKQPVKGPDVYNMECHKSKLYSCSVCSRSESLKEDISVYSSLKHHISGFRDHLNELKQYSSDADKAVLTINQYYFMMRSLCV